MEENVIPLESQRSEKQKCWKGIPCRYVFALLCFSSCFNMYSLRANLNIALVAMVNSTNKVPQGNVSSEECPDLVPESVDGTTLTLGSKFNWDIETQSKILGSFSYGNFITQLPGGILAEKYGGKWLCAFGIGVTSLLTLLTPLAARRGGAPALIALRAIEGLAEGVMFPALACLLAKWSPVTERSRMMAFMHSGVCVGTVVSFFLSGLLCSSPVFGGWPSSFYVFGTFGCIWSLFWMICIYENPSDHPRITKAELFLIQLNQENKSREKISVPWKSILTSVPVWSLIITFFGQFWGFFTLFTELPTYLHSFLHFDIGKNGLMSALPYVARGAFSLIASYITDRLRSSGKMKITTIRKIMNSVAFFGPALCIGSIVLMGCEAQAIVPLLILAMGFTGFMYSGFYTTTVDMSPQYAGTITGLCSSVGEISGFLAPALVGRIINGGHTMRNWHVVFLIATGIYVVSGLVFDIFSTAELQPWGSQFPREEESNQNSQKTEKSPKRLKCQF